MNTSNTDKQYNIIDLLFLELPYDYQIIIINSLKPLIKNYSIPEPTAPYEVSGIISYFQDKKGLSDQQLCDLVTELYSRDNPYNNDFFPLDTLRSIKKRNSQKSPKWQSYIAEALDIDYDFFNKYSSNEEMPCSTQINYEANTFEFIYKSLDERGHSTANILILSLYEQLFSKLLKKGNGTD